MTINRCSGNCNNINDPYARICVPDTVKYLSFKVFNLMSKINETRSIKWHETCKCICRLDKIICNNKQNWNLPLFHFCLLLQIILSNVDVMVKN